MTGTLRCLAIVNGTDAAGGGRVSGGNYYPPPPPGSVTFDVPGVHTFTKPPDLGPVRLEVWGGGSSPDSGNLTSGADGGAGAGYAACTVGGPLWVAGAEVSIVVGAGAPATDFAQPGASGDDSTASTVGTLHLVGHGGTPTVGGTGAVTQVGAAGSAIVTAAGAVGSAHVGEAGGAGGKANGGGGLGGAGGAQFVNGSPGQTPGGGGGGGGIQAGCGAGGGGRVRISWPPA